jgi:hypothetical protein
MNRRSRLTNIICQGCPKKTELFQWYQEPSGDAMPDYCYPQQVNKGRPPVALQGIQQPEHFYLAVFFGFR